VLLAFLSDWRWGADGQQNDWYQSVRLFRQETPGDWATPIATLASSLRHAFG